MINSRITDKLHAGAPEPDEFGARPESPVVAPSDAAGKEPLVRPAEDCGFVHLHHLGSFTQFETVCRFYVRFSLCHKTILIINLNISESYYF